MFSAYGPINICVLTSGSNFNHFCFGVDTHPLGFYPEDKTGLHEILKAVPLTITMLIGGWMVLMKGMEGDADANRDGKITLGEMQAYLTENVGRQAGMMNRKQEPQLVGDANRVLVGR